MTTDTKAVTRWDYCPRRGMDQHPKGAYIEFTEHQRELQKWQAGAAATMFRMTDALDKQIEKLRTALAASRAEVEGLRRTMEIIAVGDSRNAMSDATEALVAYGFWTAMENGNV